MAVPEPAASSELDELTGELLDRYEEINLLYDIGGALAGVFDVDLIGRTVVDRAMAVTRAGGGLFLLVEGDSATVSYRGGEFPDALLLSLTDGVLLPRVLASTLVVAQPIIAARVQRDGRVFAVIALTGKADDIAFTAGDGRLLQALAEQAGAAIHTEHLVRELRASERMRGELEIARRLQSSLLPATAPRIPGLELIGTCQPSGHVGGDYFDFFSLPNGQLGIVIADVSGHGVSSAIVMAGLRSTLHAEVREDFSPAHVLERANAVLVKDFAESGMFVSVFLATYDPASGRLAYSNAGHPPPFLISEVTKDVERLESGGLLLGILPDATYESGMTTLAPGAVVVFYTDGLTEARAGNGPFFGDKALESVIQDGLRLGAADLHAVILASVRAHLGGSGADDDVTLVVAARPK